VPIVEKPNPYDNGQGWTRTAEGVLEPLWSYGAVLPDSLVDLLDTDDTDDDESEDEGTDDDEEFDFEFEIIDSDDE